MKLSRQLLTYASILGFQMHPVWGQRRSGGKNKSACYRKKDDHFLYIMSNAIDGNEVIAYKRTGPELALVGNFSTNGVGGTAQSDAFDPIGSQDSLIATSDCRCLIGVNAGSDTIFSFLIEDDGLALASTPFSGGNFPVSVAQHKKFVYALNSGSDATVATFKLYDDCKLKPSPKAPISLGIPRSTTSSSTLLSLPSSTGLEFGDNPPFFITSPTQIEVTQDGRYLVVGVKGNPGAGLGKNIVFALDNKGELGNPKVTNSVGFVPFGFDFFKDYLVRTEVLAQGPLFLEDNGPLNFDINSTVSSYKLNKEGELTPITKSLDIGQQLACWLKISDNCIVTSNAAISLSLLSIDKEGKLTLVNSLAAFLDTPLEIFIDDVSDKNKRYVYALATGFFGSGGEAKIHAYELDADCKTLTEVFVTSEGVPTAAQSVFGVAGLTIV